MAGSRTLKLSILADVDNLKKNLDTGSKEVEGFGGKLEKFGKVAAAAFAAAAAAAVAYAGKLAIDGVKAAIEDEAAQNRLATALKNVTGATNAQIQSVEKQIAKMESAYGVADDQLRPAYQRLATATGDLSKAESALSLALDISAATGKSVETVANALGKAYEGNTTALGRLGIGLSTAEIKSLGLDGTMKQLAETFEGAATAQANTLEGQIERLRVSFDNAKEAIGYGLLPIVKQLMDYFVNTFIPLLQTAKDKAIDPIKEAFDNNREAMRDLWQFIKTYLVPVFEFTLVNAIVGVGKAIASIINVIAAVVDGIKSLVRNAVEAINSLISLVNKIPGVNIPTLGLPGFVQNSQTSGRISSSTGSINIPTPATGGSSAGSVGGSISGGTSLGGVGSSTTTKAVSEAASAAKVGADALAKAIVDMTPQFAGTVAEWRAKESGDVINMPASLGSASAFDVARVRAANEGITIVVQAPSAIDKEGFSRAVVDALNESKLRNGGGTGVLML